MARHIDQTTFALFKAIGVRGVQYYSWLVPTERYDEFADLGKQIGWLHVRAVDGIAEHKVIEQIGGAVRHFEQHPTFAAGKAILAGESHLAFSSASPEVLLAWVTDAAVEMAKGWSETVSRWGVWSRYRVPRRPGAVPQQYIPLTHPEPPTPTTEGAQQLDSTTSPTRDPATPDTPQRWSFGRETKITRVPINLRRY